MTMHAGDSPETRPVARRPRRPGHGTAESKLMTSIVDSSDDAIFSETLDGVITTWNKAAERLYGYQAEEIIGHSVSLLMPSDRPDEMAEILDRIRSGERVDHYETTRRRKDGATIAISLTVSPIHDAAGGIVGASSIAHGITESERIRDQARLAAQYARSLIEASRDPLVTISPEGKITDVNEATIRMIGVEREHLVGTDFSDYFTEPDRAREGYRQVFAQGFVADYPLIHPAGRRRPDRRCSTTPRCTRTRPATVLGVLAAARDVTDSKRQLREISETRAFLDNILQSSTKYSIIGHGPRPPYSFVEQGSAPQLWLYGGRGHRQGLRHPPHAAKTWSPVPPTACWPLRIRMAWPRVRSSESGRMAPGSPPASS